MTNVERLEREIRNFSRDELATFREWFGEYDSDEWNRQIEDDVRSGRLRALADEARAAHKSGKTKEL